MLSTPNKLLIFGRPTYLLQIHEFFCKYNQLGAQIFLISLLLFSTRFGQICVHHQEKIPYLCRAEFHSVLHTRQSSI